MNTTLIKSAKKVNLLSQKYIKDIEKKFLTSIYLVEVEKSIQEENKKKEKTELLVNEKEIIKQNEKAKRDLIIQVGNLIKIGYTIFEGNKERIQYFEGLIISKKNRGAGQTFTIRRTVENIGLEQIFFINSPKIKSIVKKQSFKVKRAKLYFFRFLQKKTSKLKTKF